MVTNVFVINGHKRIRDYWFYSCYWWLRAVDCDDELARRGGRVHVFDFQTDERGDLAVALDITAPTLLGKRAA